MIYIFKFKRIVIESCSTIDLFLSDHFDCDLQLSLLIGSAALKVLVIAGNSLFFG